MNNLFFCITLFITIISYSQNTELVYHFTKSINLKLYDIKESDTVSEKSIIAQSGWRLKIDHAVSGGYVIKFLNWKNDNNPTIIDKAYNEAEYIYGNGGKPMYFISEKEFNLSVEEYRKPDPIVSFSAGALTIPIKIRPSGNDRDDEGNKIRPFDFGGDISLGLTTGLRIRLDKTTNNFLTITTGINITAVTIDENTVRNNVVNMGDSENSTTQVNNVTTKTNAAALSPILGLIFEHKRIQIIGAMGWDRLAGRIGERWVYQGKPWFGLGIGYKIFNTSNNNPNNNP